MATSHHSGDGAGQGRLNAGEYLFHLLDSSGERIYDVYHRAGLSAYLVLRPVTTFHRCRAGCMGRRELKNMNKDQDFLAIRTLNSDQYGR